MKELGIEILEEGADVGQVAAAPKCCDAGPQPFRGDPEPAE